MNQSQAFALLRQALSDGALVQSLRANPVGTLTGHGITDPEEAQAFMAIFGLMFSGWAGQQEAGQRMQAQMLQAQEDTLAVAKQMKLGLQATLEQIDRAYRSTMLMYQTTFYLGVILVLASVVAAFVGREGLLSAIFGSLGIMDLLAFFLFKPQERLQASRASLAQVQAALFNWFMDSVNLNTLMGVMGQSNDYSGAQKVSESLLAHTEKTLEMLQKYCKLSEG